MSKVGNTQTEIANGFCYSQLAIKKELIRNRGQSGDRPKQAHMMANAGQFQEPRREAIIKSEVEVTDRLKRKHSPEQISEGLRREGGHLLSLYKRKSQTSKLFCRI